ncbi:hypothetical protein PK35_11715 [Tamlana nanhaiensis]|uniref:Iron transporter n=1 Tax=Neotamlana nanhaiensis TaxID=1382798 RepID=A0A0D7W070_9FLAO|nr:hypothetical protein [Tamlana nanhaiensis]KJD32098.1 hypothetical protein PK35_10830 [Tamlana nanhaiensis]KJD32260.1 hypothetical protein PK35_11715 [Tamlana nanhaiensis]
MPANKKHLSTPWQRFAKITAGFIGGFLVTVTLHMALAIWINPENVIITSSFTGFMLWITLMIWAFVAENGWKIWGIFIALSVLFYALVYLGNTYVPLV